MSSDTVRLVFTRSRSIGSLLLRTFLWSQWSHVAIVAGDRVVEASTHGGVGVRPLAELLQRSSRHEFLDVPASDPEAVVFAALTQVGKGYDWLGAAGIGLRRRIESTDRWFCSELVAWAFARGGSPLVRVTAWRITPRDLYLPIWTAR